MVLLMWIVSIAAPVECLYYYIIFLNILCGIILLR
nr:MAG TPA: hypothetical protein [Caudoviricetes sp.]